MKSLLALTLIFAITAQWVSASTDFQRTVIFIQKQVNFGQFVFLRGGIDQTRRSGCTEDASTSACAIPIEHRLAGTEEYKLWKEGDSYLDWYGREESQDETAEGTPMTWTTNDADYNETVSADGYGYTPLNTFGEHYWMTDLNVDCSKTDNGWFELKGFVPGADGWESDVNQDSTCSGPEDVDRSKPYSTGNHFARCGFLNVFVFTENGCEIDTLE